MRFTSLTLLSVFLITVVSAVPAPDKYQHRYEPDCPVLRSTACLLVDWCQHHRDRGDLFTTPNNELKSRDFPETQYSDLNLTDASSPSSFATRELDVNSKRTPQPHNIARSLQCGTLSCVTGREVSERFATLIAGMFYDVIIDYPYNGATGGFVGVVAGVGNQVIRVGKAMTGFGGVRFTFQAVEGAIWYRVMFVGGNVATAAINYFITMHG